MPPRCSTPKILHRAGELRKQTTLAETLKINMNMKPIDIARKYSKLGWYKKAVEIYYGIIAEEPRNAIANYELGRCLYRMSILDLALKFCSTAVKLDPNLPQAYLLLGTIFERRNQFDEAEHVLRSALALDPLQADIVNRLGICLLRQGHVEESLEMFQRALEIDKDFWRAHLHIARIYFKDNRSPLYLEHGWKAFRSSRSLLAFYWLLVFSTARYPNLYGFFNAVMIITLAVSSSKVVVLVAVPFLISVLLMASITYRIRRKDLMAIYITIGLMILLWYLIHAFVI